MGKIVKVWEHEASEKLYCEEIDIGGGVIRRIGSGLRKHVTLEQMQDALVCVICNLKARKLAGFESHGMVLCAETPDQSKIEMLRPPEGAVPGDLVHFPGSARDPPESLPGKNNAWDKTVDDLKISENGVANYKGQEFTVEGKGVCKSTTVTNGVVH